MINCDENGFSLSMGTIEPHLWPKRLHTAKKKKSMLKNTLKTQATGNANADDELQIY